MTSGPWEQITWVARTRASRIGRARRVGDGSSALLKVAAADATHFREEFALLRTLDVPGVVRPLELTHEGALPAMVLDDSDVVALAGAIDAVPFDVGAALRLGCTLARALAGLHAANVPHGDLRPANILLDRNAGQAWIADLSAAVERRRAASHEAVPVDDWA